MIQNDSPNKIRKSKKIYLLLNELATEIENVEKEVNQLEDKSYSLKEKLRESNINFFSFFSLGIVGATLVNLFTNLLHDRLSSLLNPKVYYYSLLLILLIFIKFALSSFNKIVIKPLKEERKEILIQASNKKNLLKIIAKKLKKLEKENNKLIKKQKKTK